MFGNASNKLIKRNQAAGGCDSEVGVSTSYAALQSELKFLFS